MTRHENMTSFLSSQHQRLVRYCVKRKPLLKNGSDLNSDCLYLNKVFFEHVACLYKKMGQCIDMLKSGTMEHDREILSVLSQFNLSTNLVIRYFNDSISPLSRRSDEASLVMICILHQDVCAVSDFIEDDILVYLKALHMDVLALGSAGDRISISVSEVFSFLQSKMENSLPVIAINIERAIQNKIASAVADIMYSTCDEYYFSPKPETALGLLLGETIEIKCLNPLLDIIKRYNKLMSAQRTVTATIESTMDTIFRILVRNSSILNDKGVYLLYMQINYLCAWVLKMKSEFGITERKPFLIRRSGIIDVNFFLSVLQSSLCKEKERRLVCGSTCFPFLKYKRTFSSVVVPDPDGIVLEEGKSASETPPKLSPYYHHMKVVLEELVTRKNEYIPFSCVPFCATKNAAKIFCAVRISCDSL